jgi:hypothetical protein
MKVVRAVSSIALAAGLFAACGGLPERRVDITAPRLVSAQPGSGVVPANVTFRLRFSEPLKRSTVFWSAVAADGGTVEAPDAVLLVPATARDKVVRSSSGKTSYAVDNLPLSQTERESAVPAEVALSEDRTELTVAPSDGLTPDATYHLFLSRELADDANNRLVNADTKVNESFELRFVVAPAVDDVAPVARLRSPVAGQDGVSLELDTVEVSFSEPVDHDSVDLSRAGLVETSTGMTMSFAGHEWRGDVLALALPAALPDGYEDGTGMCATLCIGDRYTLSADGLVRDVAGNASVTDAGQAFGAAMCMDTFGPRFGAAAEVVVDDTTARLVWTTDEPSSSEVYFSLCGDGVCPEPVVGASAACDVDVCALPDEVDAFACVHTVELKDLEPSTTFTVTLASADAGGRATSGETLTFTTLAPQPRLAITELFATPQGIDVNKGKFVEIQNVGRIAVDLAPATVGGGWKLARCSDAVCGTTTNVWPMKPATGSGTLAPGDVAVAAGRDFDAAAMGVPAGTMLLKHDGNATTVLSNGLTSTTAYTYALLSPEGKLVSTYGAHLGKPDAAAVKGRSFERAAPGAPDTAGNWRACDLPVAGAPGNFATPGVTTATAN